MSYILISNRCVYLCAPLILNSMMLLGRGFKLSIPPEEEFPASCVSLLNYEENLEIINLPDVLKEEIWKEVLALQRMIQMSATEASFSAQSYTIMLAVVGARGSAAVCACVRAGNHLPPFYIQQALGKEEESIFFLSGHVY